MIFVFFRGRNEPKQPEPSTSAGVDYFSISSTTVEEKETTVKDEGLDLPTTSKAKPKGSLPTPHFGRENLGNSVFNNRYVQEENNKLSVLEKHVKLSEPQLQVLMPNGKKRSICHNFLRGQCRFGQKCRYHHGSEPLVVNNSASATDPSSAMGLPPTFIDPRVRAGNMLDDGAEDDDSYMAEAKRKKRAGMAETLVPPKRAMSALQRQRQSDSPWTVQ